MRGVDEAGASADRRTPAPGAWPLDPYSGCFGDISANNFPVRRWKTVVFHGQGGISAACRMQSIRENTKNGGEKVNFLLRLFLCFRLARGKISCVPHVSCGKEQRLNKDASSQGGVHIYSSPRSSAAFRQKTGLPPMAAAQLITKYAFLFPWKLLFFRKSSSANAGAATYTGATNTKGRSSRNVSPVPLRTQPDISYAESPVKAASCCAAYRLFPVPEK